MSLKNLIKHLPPYNLKYQIFDRRHGPVITQEQGGMVPGEGPVTFVLICGARFNQTLPNAATTSRLGWCRGFDQIGIPYLLVSVFDLARRLPQIPNPICWISGSDYIYINGKNLRALKRYRHVVWVSTCFRKDSRYYKEKGFPNMSWNRLLCKKILSSEPDYLFTISPESRFEFYEGWIRNGARLVSLPLACDATLYNTDSKYVPEFQGVELAFVGGYWNYKARQFDQYLKPYEDKLIVFGYSKWPYARYRGQLPENEEPSLYRQALISPVINEPHVSSMGVDINERVFKVLGSGGLAITDATDAYHDWFKKDELLIPESVEEFHELIQDALTKPEQYKQYREKGYQTVMRFHTYAHRAAKLCSLFGVK